MTLVIYAGYPAWKRTKTADDYLVAAENTSIHFGPELWTAMSIFWIVFVFKKSAEALGICKALTGQAVLIAAQPWPTVDSIVIALPIAFLWTVIVSLLAKPPEKEHMDKCFSGV